MYNFEFSFVVRDHDLDNGLQGETALDSIQEATVSGWRDQHLVTFCVRARTPLAALRKARKIIDRFPSLEIMWLDNDLVGIPDIASRTNRTDESIRQHVRGLRGSGGFPTPIGILKGGTFIWRWGDIAPRLAETGLLEEQGVSYIDAFSAARFMTELLSPRDSSASRKKDQDSPKGVFRQGLELSRDPRPSNIRKVDSQTKAATFRKPDQSISKSSRSATKAASNSNPAGRKTR